MSNFEEKIKCLEQPTLGNSLLCDAMIRGIADQQVD